MVKTVTAVMNSEAWRMLAVTIVMISAMASSGSVPIQYLLQSMARRSSGLDFSSQSCRPSSDTDGKTNRAAIAASTKPASPWFRNITIVTRA